MHEDHWANLWDHVDDLRGTIIRTFLIIGIGFVIVLSFYQPLLNFFINSPIEQTSDGLLKQKIDRIQIANHTTQNQFFEMPLHSSLMSSSLDLQKIDEHHYLLKPGEFLIYEEPIHSNLLIMGPIEGLVLVFKACFWLSLALTAPVWGWTWVRFISPGLTARERSILRPFVLISIVFVGLGMTFAYKITLPLANQYLTLFNSSIGQNAWTLTHYTQYVLLLCMGHAIAAELTFLLFIFVHFGFLTPDWLIAKRRYMIVLAFILGALLTPPDVLTQLLLAFPMIGLYEISILYAKFRKRKENKAFPIERISLKTNN